MLPYISRQSPECDSRLDVQRREVLKAHTNAMSFLFELVPNSRGGPRSRPRPKSGALTNLRWRGKPVHSVPHEGPG